MQGKNLRIRIAGLILCLSTPMAQNGLEQKEEDYLFAPEHQTPIIRQDDFFERNRPARLVHQNATPAEEVRINPHLDLSQFSQEVIEDSGLPVLKSPKRYNQAPHKIDFSRLMPSNSGPTGLMDSISARGLPEGKISAAFQYSEADVRQRNLFRNVNSFSAENADFLLNYGYNDHFEFSLKVHKSTRQMTTNLGTSFDSSLHGFPSYTAGLKAHQKWREYEFAVGFLHTSVESPQRNLILDQDFEHYKSFYATFTSPFTYRTETHLTLKRSDMDNKYVSGNSFTSIVYGVDTKLSQDTHLLAELKWEDLKANTDDVSLNGGLRHHFGDGMAFDAFWMRGSQTGYHETGFRISGAF